MRQLTSTVNAGPAIRVSPASYSGEYILMSGMSPPCLTPILMSASEIWHVSRERSERERVEQQCDLCAQSNRANEQVSLTAS